MRFSPLAFLALPTATLAGPLLLDPKLAFMAVEEQLFGARKALGDVASALDQCKQPGFASRMHSRFARREATPAALCYLTVPELQALDGDLLKRIGADDKFNGLYNQFVEYGAPVNSVEFWRDAGEVRLYTPAATGKPTNLLRPFKAREALLGEVAKIAARARAAFPTVSVPPVPGVPKPDPDEFAAAPPAHVGLVKGGRILTGVQYPLNFIVQSDKAAANRDVPAAAARWVEALAMAVLPELSKELEATEQRSLSSQLWLPRLRSLNEIIVSLVKLTMASDSRVTRLYKSGYAKLMTDATSIASR